MAQKQADLNAAMSQAAGVANSHSGKHVSRGVLSAQLAGIRSQYQMQALYPVKTGKTWSIYGKVNPEETVHTGALAEDHTIEPTSAQIKQDFKDKWQQLSPYHFKDATPEEFVEGLQKDYKRRKAAGQTTAENFADYCGQVESELKNIQNIRGLYNRTNDELTENKKRAKELRKAIRLGDSDKIGELQKLESSTTELKSVLDSQKNLMNGENSRRVVGTSNVNIHKIGEKGEVIQDSKMEDRLVSMSGEKNRMPQGTDLVGHQYVTSPSDSSKIFDALTLEGNDKPRENDAEYNMLTQAAQQMGAKKGDKPHENVHGTITLASDKKVCTSCEGVVQQFQRMFPNIKINVVSGPTLPGDL